MRFESVKERLKVRTNSKDVDRLFEIVKVTNVDAKGSLFRTVELTFALPTLGTVVLVVVDTVVVELISGSLWDTVGPLLTKDRVLLVELKPRLDL